MVFYKAKESYFTSLMSTLNQLRQDKTFCDIILKIGTREIHAHRSVLSAGCQYFKSLFLGQFTEATMKEINLSEVTDNVDAMEIIVNFIYSGDVEITMENLDVIVKLSSFFLLDTLRNFTADFMMNSLSLKTCLEFYLYSAEHDVSDVEKDAKLMMKSRFHDYLIFEESTLDLSPDQLLCLMKQDIFEHCSVFNTLLFIAKYVFHGKAEKHLSVGLELLDYLDKLEVRVMCKPTLLQDFSLDANFEKVEHMLQSCDFEYKEEFIVRLKAVIDDMRRKKNLVTELDGQGTSSSLTDTKPKSGSTELAVVTLSPKSCLIEDFKKACLNDTHRNIDPFNEPVFDVSVYIPRRRTWYHLCEFHDQGGMPEFLIDGSGYESRMLVLEDEIAFVDNRGDYIDLFHLKNHTWRSPNVQYYDTNIRPEIEQGHYQANDVCFVTGKGNEKYMIVRMRLFTDNSFDQATDMYFRGYILRNDGETWDCIFVTPSRIRTNLSDNGGMPEMTARISKTSNEMLVTHSTLDGGWNIVFVADLNKVFPVPVILKSEFIEDQDIFRGCVIMENEDRFLIVLDGTKNCGNVVRVLYEYKFNSKILTEVNVPWRGFATISKPYELDDEENEYPCLCESSATDGESLWYLEGNLETVSAMTEVRLDDKLRLIPVRHTPPPFASITRTFVGPLKVDILAGLKPITHFKVKENGTSK